MQRDINWVIKCSKLCNLRCTYCYEWDELAKRNRIGLDGWKCILKAVRRYHDLREQATGETLRSNLIWHGGEPTLLPDAYFRDVLRLQRRFLGVQALRNGRFRNAIQSNLFRLSSKMISILREGDFDVGVSLDLVAGVRLTKGGAPSERKVAENIDRLREEGIDIGAIVVLAAHTAPRIVDIYDFYDALCIPVRFLPLFQSPNSELPGIAISNANVIAALKTLFLHWIKRDDRVRIDPLINYVYTVYLDMLGQRQPPYSRVESGEWAILVNTDGSLYQRIDAYNPKQSMGNIFDDSIESILRSTRYKESLARDNVIWNRFCKGCQFEGPCFSLEVFESPHRSIEQRRCSVAYPMNKYIRTYFRRRRYDAKAVGEFLESM